LTTHPDRLLLLERGGRTVYFGDIGPDSSVIRSYLARLGAVCPPNLNVAEYMLEAIGAGVTPRIGSRNWGDLWTESREFADTKKEIVRLREEGLKSDPTEQAGRAAACEFIVISDTCTSFHYQAWTGHLFPTQQTTALMTLLQMLPLSGSRL